LFLKLSKFTFFKFAWICTDFLLWNISVNPFKMIRNSAIVTRLVTPYAGTPEHKTENPYENRSGSATLVGIVDHLPEWTAAVPEATRSAINQILLNVPLCLQLVLKRN